MASQRGIRRIYRLLLPLAALVLLALLGQVMGCNGWARGVEYSPDLLSHRSFRYLVCCGVQVTPKQTDVWRSSLDDYLYENKYATPASTHPPRWRLVQGFSPGIRGWSGEVKFVCQGLGCWESTDSVWVDWSEEHPKLAAVLWPRVVAWLRSEEYDRVTHLFFFQERTLREAEDTGTVEALLLEAERSQLKTNQ